MWELGGVIFASSLEMIRVRFLDCFKTVFSDDKLSVLLLNVSEEPFPQRTERSFFSITACLLRSRVKI